MKMILFFLLIPTMLLAQWQADGLPFLASKYSESIEYLLPDDEGNVYVFWFSMHLGFKIRVGKVDTAGYRMWPTDSLLVCYYPEQQRGDHAVPDGEGGFVVAWRDTRADLGAGDIYAQRVDKNGNLLWDVNGMPVIIAEDYQDEVKLCMLEDSTFIVTCEDERIGFNKVNIFAQRLDKNGKMLWDSSGIRLTYSESDNMYLNWQQRLLSCKDTTFIIVWNFSDFGTDNTNIYAQKLDRNGNFLWDSLGVAVADLPYPQGEFGDFSICSDGAGGVVVAWHDKRDYWKHGIYVQRVDSSGHCVWQDNGILQPGSFYHPSIVYADSMHYLLFWDEISIKMQKINANGEFLFGKKGKVVSHDTSGWGASYPHVVRTNDGVIVVWRRGNSDGVIQLYSQKLDLSGNRVWEDRDVPVSTVFGDKYSISLCSDLHGGAYVGWIDERDMPNGHVTDAYLQRLYADGHAGGVTAIPLSHPHLPSTPVLYQNYPNPFNQQTIIRFQLPQAMPVSLAIYNLNGQKIKILIDKQYLNSGMHRVSWSGKNDRGIAIGSGVYFVRLDTGHHQLIKKMIYLR